MWEWALGYIALLGYAHRLWSLQWVFFQSVIMLCNKKMQLESSLPANVVNPCESTGMCLRSSMCLCVEMTNPRLCSVWNHGQNTMSHEKHSPHKSMCHTKTNQITKWWFYVKLCHIFTKQFSNRTHLFQCGNRKTTVRVDRIKSQWEAVRQDGV
jgi:hypothetical protein